MLILTRRINESVVIGNNIVLTVLGVKGSQVRIGIKAPTEVTVNREEIHERITKTKNSSYKGQNNFLNKQRIHYNLRNKIKPNPNSSTKYLNDQQGNK